MRNYLPEQTLGWEQRGQRPRTLLFIVHWPTLLEIQYRNFPIVDNYYRIILVIVQFRYVIDDIVIGLLFFTKLLFLLKYETIFSNYKKYIVIFHLNITNYCE